MSSRVVNRGKNQDLTPTYGWVSFRSTIATVCSHAIDSVALDGVALTKTIVNCSIETSADRTAMGARSTSNFGS
jgi:hypothetical protein